jgi:hypothetical protein
MSPWVEGKVRLADRRGIFQRGDLSRVQDICLQLLMATEAKSDMVVRQRSFQDALRFALMAASGDPTSFRSLFPEVFTQESLDHQGAVEVPPEGGELTDEQIETIIGGAPAGNLRFDQEISEEEAQMVLAGLMNNKGVSLGINDLDEGWS